jgi:uncharacterized protein with ATP-grasp and redox domains
MKTYLDCIPCFVHQAVEASRFVTDDVDMHEKLVRHVLQLTAGMNMNRPPPEIGQAIHRKLRELTGVEDPYREPKRRFTRLALDMLPHLAALVKRAPDPLASAVRLAIAANIIDLAAGRNPSEAEVRGALENALTEPFVGDLEDFRRAAGKAGSILYLADNAGEIVVDRLLIEELGPGRVTVAVRGAAVINDATLTDAQEAGVHELAAVIDNGSDAPGTILDDCSEPFRRRFSEADLVVAKGQGNFETLSDAARVFFLFKVKCPVVSEHVGLPAGTHILRRLGDSGPLPGAGSGGSGS